MADKIQRTQNPTAAKYNVQLGIAYLQQGDVDRARMKLQLALAQDPNSTMALDAMAYFLEQTGETGVAERYYRQAIAVGRDMGNGENNYGTFLCRQKRFAEAQQHFMAAVRDPRYMTPGEAYENAGLCAMQVPDEKQAQEYFVKALQRQPKLPKSLLELVHIEYNQGHYVEAQNYYNRFVAAAGKQNGESLLLGLRLAQHFGEQSVAANYAQQLQSQFPHSQEYLTLMNEMKS